MDTAQTLELSDDYFYAAGQLAALVDGIAELISKLDLGSLFTGSIEYAGPPRTRKNYEELQAWKAAAAAANDRAFASIHGEGGRRAWFNIDSDQRRVSVSVTIADGESERASAALRELKEKLGLVTESERERLRSQVQRLYRIGGLDDASFVEKAATVIAAALGDVDRFDGSYRGLDQPRSWRNESDLTRWTAAVRTTWASLVDIQGRWRAAGDSVSLTVHRDERQIELEVTGYENAAALADRIEQDLALTNARLTGGQAERQGVRRRFFLSNDLSEAWLRTSMQRLRSLFPGGFTFRGEIRFEGSPEVHTRSSADAWEADLLRDWQKIAFSSRYLSTGPLTINFALDHQRELVDASVEAADEKERDGILESLQRDLLLVPINTPASATPYEARSTAVYRIKSLVNRRFAEAVRTAVEQFFPRTPAVVDARVNDVESNSVDVYHTVDAFLERLESAKPYDEVHLHIEGQRGNALGVHVESSGKRLTIRSSLTPDEVEQVSTIFTRRLSLGPRKSAEDRDEAGAPPEKEGRAARWLLPVLTLVLGFVLSEAFLRAAFPKTELRITVPPAPEKRETVVGVPSGNVMLSWTVEQEHWFRHRRDFSAPAHVTVTSADTGKVADDRPRALPGKTVLHLPKGTYYVEVVAQSDDAADQETLAVP